jgi:hypothetical protein
MTLEITLSEFVKNSIPFGANFEFAILYVSLLLTN